MDVNEFVAAIGGEIVRGRARKRIGRDYVVIGKLTEDGMIFTREGAAMKAQYLESGSIDAPTEVADVEEPEVEAEVAAAPEPVVEEEVEEVVEEAAPETEEPAAEAEEVSADLEDFFAELDADDESNAS